MCGIAGLTGPNAGKAVETMRDAVAHRGPDGFGLYEDEHLALGQRRLAIIDLTDAGKQPFPNDSGSLQLVWNGEIYNYVELRKELEQLGHRFRSASDTEVIVRGWEQWGEKVLERLNGMFAIALWARPERKLYLARDRGGEKPLHMGWLEGKDGGPRRFAFASELRSILACPLVQRPRPSPLGIARFLAYEYVPAPGSPLEGLEKLGAGEALELDLATGKTRRWRYWEPNYGTDARGKLALSLEEAKERLRELLEASVRIRLRSDVPLGIFLSGGVDSSTVAALARRLLGSAELRTFSIGFEEKAFDESSHARKVARHLGTRHVEETVSEKTLLEVLPQVLAHQDEPLADSSLLPTTLVSRLARREVTVVLGGDGGDELFCGYDPFKAWTASRLYELVPSFVHSGVALPLARALPSSREKVGLDFKAQRFLRGAVRPRPLRLASWMGAFEAGELAALLAPDVRRAVESDLAPERLYAPTIHAWEAAGPAGTVGDVDRQSSVYLRTYLPDGVLQKVDRASMSCALETRAPLLDPEVMDFAFRLPEGLKYRRLETKRVLKALARELVPPEVIDRPKQGFAIPLRRWLSGPLRPLVEETLAPERVKSGGLLDPAAVARLLALNAEGRADQRQIWTLLVLETWRQRWL